MKIIHRTSEFYALLRLRRSLIIVVIGYGYFLLAFALWRRGAELPALTKLIIIIGFVIALAGGMLSRKEIGLWTMIISFGLVTLHLVIDPLTEIAWMQLSVLVAILCLAVVFMNLGRRQILTLTLVAALALGNFLAYYLEATSLLRSGSFLGRGSISSFMLFSTSLYAIYGWNRMLVRAKSNDKEMDALQSENLSLEKSRANQRYWRDLVIRVHETTLNTIRSLLTLREVPIENLRSELEKSLAQDSSVMTRAQERRSGSVIGAIRKGIDSAALSERVKIISQGINLHLDNQVAEVVERVIREALRNATDHAKASSIEILWRTTVEPSSSTEERERGRLSITISDNGTAEHSQRQMGIGTTLVMDKSIKDLGGSFDLRERTSDLGGGTVVVIELPTAVEKNPSRAMDFPSFSAVNLGRYMALLTLFGPAVLGVFFFPILSMWWSGQFLSQISGFLTLSYLLYATFIREKRLGWIESTVVALGLLAIINFLNLDPLTCVGAQPFQWVINSVVYGLFIILLWGKWQVTALAYPVFLYLVAPLHSLVPQSCNFIFNFPILNTLFSFLFVAVIFTLVYRTFERVENFQVSRVSKNLALVAEIEKNDQSFEKILELDAQAKETISELLSATGPISTQTQLKLRKIDSELRAQMQVDPIISAGLTRLAADFVHQVTGANRWLDVKSIHGDEDARPIPDLFKQRFLAIANDIPSGTSIQVVVGDSYAELSLRARCEVPDSVLELSNFAHESQDPELSVVLKRESSQEFVLFMRRERPSQ